MKKTQRTWKKGFLLHNWDQNDIAWQGFYLTEVSEMLQAKCDMKIIPLFIDLWTNSYSNYDYHLPWRFDLNIETRPYFYLWKYSPQLIYSLQQKDFFQPLQSQKATCIFLLPFYYSFSLLTAFGIQSTCKEEHFLLHLRYKYMQSKLHLKFVFMHFR